MDPRRPLRPVVRAFGRLVYPLTRGLTLGVRALVFDDRGRVCLVSHSYVPGWHLPGGGVERGERMDEALGRELAEEARVEPTAPPVLLGLMANFSELPTDHVGLYEVRHWRPLPAGRRGAEIIDRRFFDPDDLPADTTPATSRRIGEALAGRPPPADW